MVDLTDITISQTHEECIKDEKQSIMKENNNNHMNYRTRDQWSISYKVSYINEFAHFLIATYYLFDFVCFVTLIMTIWQIQLSIWLYFEVCSFKSCFFLYNVLFYFHQMPHLTLNKLYIVYDQQSVRHYFFQTGYKWRWWIDLF